MFRNFTKVVALTVIAIVLASTAFGFFAFQIKPVVGQQTKPNIVIGGTGGVGELPTPWYSHGGSDELVTAQIFEGLLRFKPGTVQVEPALAMDLGQVSTDGMTWVYKLRQGVMFHDGTPFNATAVKLSYDKAFVIKGGVTYIFTDVLAKTDIIDTYTVQFTLKRPYNAWPAVVASFPSFIISPSSVLKYGDKGVNDHPIGTGPFKFVSKILDNEVRLEANQAWWRLAADKVNLNIGGLVVKNFADAGTMKLAIERGDIDSTFGVMNPTDYPSLLQNKGLKPYMQANRMRWIQIQTNSSNTKYFSNKLMRQALAYATPYDDIVNSIFDNAKYGEKVYSFLPPEYAGYVKDWPYTYDPQKSLSLIKQAGFTAPVKIELWITADYGPRESDVAALFKARAEPAGFSVNIQQVDLSALKQRYRAVGGVDLSMWRWTADIPDSDDWATPFIGPTGFSGKPSGFTASDMKDIMPHINQILVENAKSNDPTRQSQILKELQDLYAEWVPGLLLYRQIDYTFTRASLSGLVMSSQFAWDVHYYLASFATTGTGSAAQPQAIDMTLVSGVVIVILIIGASLVFLKKYRKK